MIEEAETRAVEFESFNLARTESGSVYIVLDLQSILVSSITSISSYDQIFPGFASCPIGPWQTLPWTLVSINFA